MFHTEVSLKVSSRAVFQSFRRCQKASDKDIANIASVLLQFCQRLDFDNTDLTYWDKVELNLDNIETHLASLLQRLQKTAEESRCVLDSAKEFSELTKNKEFDENAHRKLIIAEHLERRGFHKTGKLISARHGLILPTHTEIFKTQRKIVAGLRCGLDVDLALRWCGDFRSGLRRINSELEFRLHKAAFLSLIEKGEYHDAVVYAKKNLSRYTEEHLQEIQQLMGALAFVHPSNRRSNGASIGPVDQYTQDGEPIKRPRLIEIENGNSHDKEPTNVDIMDHTNSMSSTSWLELALLFERDSSFAIGIESPTMFEVMLKAGLSSLRTPNCSYEYPSLISAAFESDSAGISSSTNGLSETEPKPQPILLGAGTRRALNCPCCTNILGRIAKKMPMAQQEHSALICRISGQKMNENNPPVMLPNGQVFSWQALKGMAKNGMVVCPVEANMRSSNPSEQGEEIAYPLSLARKLYVA